MIRGEVKSSPTTTLLLRRALSTRVPYWFKSYEYKSCRALRPHRRTKCDTVIPPQRNDVPNLESPPQPQVRVVPPWQSGAAWLSCFGSGSLLGRILRVLAPMPCPDRRPRHFAITLLNRVENPARPTQHSCRDEKKKKRGAMNRKKAEYRIEAWALAALQWNNADAPSAPSPPPKLY